MTKKQAKSYEQLSEELELVLSQLQDESTSIEQALRLYEQGISLVKQLEEYLKTAENKLNKLAKADV